MWGSGRACLDSRWDEHLLTSNPPEADGRATTVTLLQESGSVPRRAGTPDVQPVEAAVAPPVDQSRQRAGPRLDPEHEPAAPGRGPPAGEPPAQAEAPALLAQPADAVPSQQVDEDLHADANARLPRTAVDDVAGRAGTPARRGPAPDHAAVRHDHGPAPPAALGPPAGDGRRLLAGRTARGPEAALARRRAMSLRHVQASVPPSVGPAGPAGRPAARPVRTLGPLGPPVWSPTGVGGLGRRRRRREDEEEGNGRRYGDPGSSDHADWPSGCEGRWLGGQAEVPGGKVTVQAAPTGLPERGRARNRPRPARRGGTQDPWAGRRRKPPVRTPQTGFSRRRGGCLRPSRSVFANVGIP